MAVPFIIVESEAKAKVMEQCFDGQAEFLVVAAPPVQPFHHETIAESCGPDLQFSCKVLPEQNTVIEKLLAITDQAVMLALDYDLRSEYLGWLLSLYLSIEKSSVPVRRLRAAGFSKSRVKEAESSAGPVDDEKGKLFYIRSLFDSYLAKHFRRLLGTHLGPANLPLTHMSLATLFLLADRETEIRLHTPRKKWGVMAELAAENGKFMAKMAAAHGVTENEFVKDRKEGMGLVEKIKLQSFVVKQVDRSDLTIETPAPYTLTELLTDAQVLHALDPRRVNAGLKTLSHGIEVDGEQTGLISAPAFQEYAFSDEWLSSLRKCATELYEQDSLQEETVKPAAGMLLPLRPELDREKLESLLDEDSLKIYDLIYSRALASQMIPATGESLNVQFGAGEQFVFQAHFNSIIDHGFLEAYQGRHGDDLVEECPFADIEVGQELELVRVSPEQSMGIPAERYTYETLFTDLTDFSMEPDSLALAMLQAMIDRGYLGLTVDGFLTAGPNASKVAGIMAKAFPRMKGVNLSAYVEQTIAESHSGRKGLDAALVQFDQTMMIHGKILVKAKVALKYKSRTRTSSSIIKTEPPPVPTPPPAPAQEVEEAQETVETAEAPEPAIAPDLPVEEEAVRSHPVAEGAGEPASAVEAAPEDEDVPEFLVEPEAFENVSEEDEWPEEVKKVFDKVLTEPEAEPEPEPEPMAPRPSTPTGAQDPVEDKAKQCQVCGKPMLLKQDKFGKFWSCSGFPACRHSETYEAQESPAMKCPVCKEGSILIKRTPTGKTFYVCNDTECEFMVWAKPHQTPCQICESPYLVEKTTAQGQAHLRCPRAGCNYMQSLPGQEGVAGTEPTPAKKKVRVRRVKKGSGGKKVRVVRRRK